MEKLLKYRPPRIAALLTSISVIFYYSSPADTLLYIPYKLIGSISITGGFALMIWAWLQFRTSKTAVCPTAETSLIIMNGAYRISRNPMYIGMLLMLTGIALFMGTIEAFFAPATFFIIMDKVFIPFEEKKLLNGFENHYADYLKQTRRWV